ncbi:PREDICTED: uncharacterized protein LOC108358166, partial [Rhagoletis zephyria]|uniref:uncharacterized protein LOC108358166 n=1 Tax=Rhagoletis zephyria TaxID=28612 RepID=UPI0008117271
MQNFSQETFVFQHEELLNIWEECGRKSDVVFEWVIKKIKNNELSLEKKDDIRKKIRNLFSYVTKKLSNCNRSLKRFKEKHATWISATAVISISDKDYEKPCSSKIGRPQVNYTCAKDRMKRKLANDLSSEKDHNTDLM